MFIRYYTEIALPAETVAAALADDPKRWLPGVAARADACAQSLLVKVGLGNEQHRIGKLVNIELGTPMHIQGKTLIPIKWRATGSAGFFPTLEADLEVGVLDERLTQLALAGTYQPPLGYLGIVADRALLHRVAEATVKNFVDGLATAITTYWARSDGPFLAR